jgi:uncharacterized membrane protein
MQSTGIEILGDSLASDIYGASGASADGSVVVGLSDTGGGCVVFRWTAATGLVPLWSVPAAPGYCYSSLYPLLVSADGNVVVGPSRSGGVWRIERWTVGDSAPTPIPAPPGYTHSCPTHVSDDGSVIVGFTITPQYPSYSDDCSSEGYAQEAFRWTQATGSVGLGFLPGRTHSVPAGITPDGAVIAGTSSNNHWAYSFEPFRWTQAGGMVGLGTPPGVSPFSMTARAISADGTTVVGGYRRELPSRDLAFRWTGASGTVSLEDDQEAEASDVSADGSIAVGTLFGYGTKFLWDAPNGMRGLRDVLLDNFGLNVEEDCCYDIFLSDDGETLVGNDWIAHVPPDACTNGFDDDGDGATDFPADPGCLDTDDRGERDAALACDDALDDPGDGDLLADFHADPGCTSPLDADETDPSLPCDDGIDDDGDGRIDLPADPGCTGADDPAEVEPGLPCDDGIDDDDDGYVDHPDDANCLSPTDPSEFTVACDDGVDNDGDGYVDQRDPGCSGGNDTDEQSASLACDDGVDNDGDGHTDYPGDPGCRFPTDLEQHGVCDDWIDNDLDGLADFPLDPVCESQLSARENARCQDGIDNDDQPGIDFDGGASLNGGVPIDAPDPECVDKPWLNTEHTPAPACGLGGEIAVLLFAARRLRCRATSKTSTR